jgi:hypothetical protein
MENTYGTSRFSTPCYPTFEAAPYTTPMPGTVQLSMENTYGTSRFSTPCYPTFEAAPYTTPMPGTVQFPMENGSEPTISEKQALSNKEVGAVLVTISYNRDNASLEQKVESFKRYVKELCIVNPKYAVLMKYTILNVTPDFVTFEVKNEDKNRKSYVIAARGTIYLSDYIGSNLNLVYHEQTLKLENYVQDMKEQYGINFANLTLIGHSMSGLSVQAVGYSLGIDNISYNPAFFLHKGAWHVTKGAIELSNFARGSQDSQGSDSYKSIIYETKSDILAKIKKMYPLAYAPADELSRTEKHTVEDTYGIKHEIINFILKASDSAEDQEKLITIIEKYTYEDPFTARLKKFFPIKTVLWQNKNLQETVNKMGLSFNWKLENLKEFHKEFVNTILETISRQNENLQETVNKMGLSFNWKLENWKEFHKEFFNTILETISRQNENLQETVNKMGFTLNWQNKNLQETVNKLGFTSNWTLENWKECNKEFVNTILETIPRQNKNLQETVNKMGFTLNWKLENLKEFHKEFVKTILETISRQNENLQETVNKMGFTSKWTYENWKQFNRCLLQDFLTFTLPR